MKSDRGGVGGLSLPEIFPQLTDLPSVELLLFLSVFKAPVSFLNRDIIHHFMKSVVVSSGAYLMTEDIGRTELLIDQNKESFYGRIGWLVRALTLLTD